jgi:Ca-activated chloride channel family protein
MNNAIQFAHPWVLFLLWLVPPAAAWWIYLLRGRTAALGRFMAPEMQSRLAPSSGAARTGWQIGLVATALSLLIVAAARPRWGTREETVIQSGRDLVIALDVSRSMLAPDVHPSRLQRAKADLLDLVGELRGDRAALLAFRYKTVTVCPLTTDYAFLRQAIDSVDVDSAPRGETDIGAALRAALDGFDNESSAHKAIVLISDGEDLAGKAMEAAELAAKRRIPVFTVGIGSTAGAKVPDPSDPRRAAVFEGREMISKLDDETLSAIARRTGGAYIAIKTAGTADTTLGTIYRDHLRKITAQELQETKQRRQVERFELFLLPAVLCLMAAAFLSRGRLRTGKAQPQVRADGASQAARAAAIAAVALGALSHATAEPAKTCPATGAACTSMCDSACSPAEHASETNGPARSVEGREGGRRAQTLYALGRYKDAAGLYVEAAQTAPRALRRDLLYNAAVAYSKAGQNDRAAELFAELSGPGSESDAAAAAGLAVSRFKSASSVTGDAPDAVVEKAERLHDAAEAFRAAARSSAEPVDLRRDLEVAFRQWVAAEGDAAAARLARDFKDRDPAELAEVLMREQRAIAADAAAAFTNEAPETIARCEALAQRQMRQADLLLPFRDRLTEAAAKEAGTNDISRQIQQVNQFISATRGVMKGASESMRDIDPAGAEGAKSAAGGTARIWELVAPFSAVLTEDILRQTNAILMARNLRPLGPVLDGETAATMQDEALRMTGLFTNRFVAAVPPEGIPAPPSTNGQQAAEGGLSKENREKILVFAEAAAGEQQDAAKQLANDKAGSLRHQHEAYRLLKEIAELLPKHPRNSEQQENKQDSQQKQEKGEQRNQEEQQARNATNSQQQAEAQTNQLSAPQPVSTNDQQTAEQPRQTNAVPMEVKAMLERALMREREHEADKRRRNQQMPMAPGARDQ